MPSLQTPIFPLVIIIVVVVSCSFLHADVDDGEALTQRRILQSNTTPTNGNVNVNGNGNGNGKGIAASLPTPKTQGAPAGGSSAKMSSNGSGGRRRKGGHGKMLSEFLNAHNEVRAKFGEPPLRWNHTLERYAQQWAAMRASDCKLVHAPNNQYGENLFWGKYKHWTARDVVKEWADEAAFYNPENHTCAEGQQCGHYTQIVWRSSVWVGCAKQTCFNGEVFVVCEYFPAGNYLDTPDPFTAKPSYPGEENHIPESPGPNMTSTATTQMATPQA